MLPASSGIGGNPFPTQDSGANRRCDCDGYRPDTLGDGIGVKVTNGGCQPTHM